MNDEIKHEIFMMYDLAGDKDLIYYEAIQRIIDYIADLEQENERLKEKNKMLQEDAWRNNADLIDNVKKELEKTDCEDYKSRIEKAVEYIKEHQTKDEFLNLNEWGTRDLLSILGDKNE